VEEACDILGTGGGFVLFPVDQVFVDTPWEKVQCMIDSWRLYCDIQT
jgi:hypothetical protein